ncbi:MAG: AAC(3) family N-acetyltransferase [Acidobacteria bacterium]|nr:AAC(3) family N-acetyltransferase [Acidobacteriota bacterium]
MADLGVRQGDTVMVHSSLRQIGPVIGGAATIINALLESIGHEGTLVAYVDFEPFFEEGDDEIPVFNKLTASAARDHGVLHEMIRTWPGSLRSNHPGAGISAIGAKAAWLTEHPPRRRHLCHRRQSRMAHRAPPLPIRLRPRHTL